MDIENNFRRIGSVNTESISDMLDKLSADSWDAVDSYPGVSIIPLAYDPDMRHAKATRHPAMQVFGKLIRPALGVVADFFDQSERGRELSAKHGVGYFIRCSFLALAPAAAIADRVDESFSEAHSHRVHLPVITNERATITVQEERLHVPAGEVYEINNLRPYSFGNGGDAAVIHLVLDYVRKGE